MRRHILPYAVWTGLKDHQQRRHVCSNDRPWDNDRCSTSFAQCTACWPPRIMQFNDYLMRKPHYKTMRFFSLRVLYALRLPDLYFWLKLCVLYSNFYGNSFVLSFFYAWFVHKILFLMLLGLLTGPKNFRSLFSVLKPEILTSETSPKIQLQARTKNMFHLCNFVQCDLKLLIALICTCT